MKTEKTVVTSSGKGIEKALSITEKLGIDSGLESRPVLHLRLIAEELFGMLHGIAKETVSDYWIEYDGKNFEFHIKSDVKMTEEMRNQFLNASSSGKNAAATGFTGKIRVFIADALLSVKEIAPYAKMSTASAYPGDTGSVWTMSDYKNEIMKNLHKDENEEADKAWDELEKSVIAKLADDIKVHIIGKNVEIIVYKSF